MAAAKRYPAYIRRANATIISRYSFMPPQKFLIELIVRFDPGNVNFSVPEWCKLAIDSFEFTENKGKADGRDNGTFWNGGLHW